MAASPKFDPRILDRAAAAMAAAGNRPAGTGVDERKTELSDQYVFARLTGAAIRALVRLDAQSVGGASSAPSRVIYRVWPDFEIRALLTHSVSTVKSDAAFTSFSAAGKNIVWAVLDSGVQGDHPHFRKHRTLELAAPLRHRDFTAAPGEAETPLVDEFGHGPHVAGIIAGELVPDDLIDPSAKTGSTPVINAIARHRDESGAVIHELVPIDKIRGVAPECQIVSVKMLDGEGKGQVSNLITALEDIGRINGYGKDMRIHGANLSVGYDFDPEWFACGQSPLRNVVDRLVRSGVVVVVAAGNTGYGYTDTAMRGSACTTCCNGCAKFVRPTATTRSDRQERSDRGISCAPARSLASLGMTAREQSRPYTLAPRPYQSP